MESFVTRYRNYQHGYRQHSYQARSATVYFITSTSEKKWRGGQTPGPLKYSFSSGNTVCLGNTQYLSLKSSSVLLNTKSPHAYLVSYYPLLMVAHIYTKTEVG